MGHSLTELRQKGKEADKKVMTNDQIPMTNEKDNDQYTNNQLNKENDRMDCMYHLWSLEFDHWSLSFSLVIGYFCFR
jgi:hypothetical protein